MEIRLDGIIVIVGNYGSGKTEVAVNLAVVRRNAGVEVRIADLDLVNPYFRAREARIPLEALGITVVLPEKKYHHADLPILAPAVAGCIKKSAGLTILDAGGDDAGTTVLKALATALKGRPVRMMQVINAFRPFTRDVAGCVRMQKQIEASAGLPVTGLISNSHLLDETDLSHVLTGYELVRKVSGETGLPVDLVTAPPSVLPLPEPSPITCPVLSIERKLLPPWKPFLTT